MVLAGAFGAAIGGIAMLSAANQTQVLIIASIMGASVGTMLSAHWAMANDISTSGREAEHIGLVHRACDPDRLMPDVLALAAELASRPPLSIALIKQCVRQGAEMPLIDGFHLTKLIKEHPQLKK